MCGRDNQPLVRHTEKSNISHKGHITGEVERSRTENAATSGKKPARMVDAEAQPCLSRKAGRGK